MKTATMASARIVRQTDVRGVVDVAVEPFMAPLTPITHIHDGVIASDQHGNEGVRAVYDAYKTVLALEIKQAIIRFRRWRLTAGHMKQADEREKNT